MLCFIQFGQMDLKNVKSICNWLFAKEAIINSDYQPSKAIDFWHKTNLEDWDICEQSQLGIQSNKYSPGPYSGQESLACIL